MLARKHIMLGSHVVARGAWGISPTGRTYRAMYVEPTLIFMVQIIFPIWFGEFVALTDDSVTFDDDLASFVWVPYDDIIQVRTKGGS